MSDSQNHYRLNHKRKDIFYSTFTNAYKNQIDQPFCYFTFDERAPGVYRPALYTLLPAGHAAKDWAYTFGDSAEKSPEKITGEPVDPSELKPAVLLKLMLALSFYESGREKERRVCQSQFYLRIKSNTTGKRVIAAEIDPKVETSGEIHTLTIKVKANKFARIDTAKVGRPELGTYYELFTSRGHGYLRQLRPDQVANFSGEVYKKVTDHDENTVTDWHHNGSKTDPNKYKESRSRQVYHVQERLSDFLQRFGFEVQPATELMQRLWPEKSALPLARLPVIQVFDNRLNQTEIPAATYLTWLNTYGFGTKKPGYTLPFELVKQVKELTVTRPLLVLTDASKEAFIKKDRQLGMLVQHDYQDPYRKLYESEEVLRVVKQTLNVNLNEVEKFTQPVDYLHYDFPAPSLPVASEEAAEENTEMKKARLRATKLFRNLNLKLEVCLSELWLKWVVAGKATENPGSTLPLLTTLSDEWGFLHRDTLLYFEQGQLCFADKLACRQVLKERFTPWSEIKTHFMARQLKYATASPDDRRAEEELRQSHFVLVGREVFELEHTDAIAMPNWAFINSLRRHDPYVSIGAKTFDALGVYAAGIWYTEATMRYVVGGAQSSDAAEARGHHVYQIHQYRSIEAAVPLVPTILSLLAVTFVRNNQYTVWPYPFDLIRLRQDVLALL